MTENLRVLLVEDSDTDAELVLRELRQGDFNPLWQRVETAAALEIALQENWDVVISDYRLPSFHGPDALEIVKQSQKDIPFILVSGTLGEIPAVAMMKAGASDYVMKDNLSRLPEAVRRELREREVRVQRAQAEEELRKSEERYRLLAQNINDLVCLHDLTGQYVYVSISCESLLGYHYDELIGRHPLDLIHPEDRDRLLAETNHQLFIEKSTPITYRIQQKSGQYIWLETLTKFILNADLEVIQLQTTSRDITQRIKVQNQLKYEAIHDTLTGLCNRHSLMERLDLVIGRAKRYQNYHFAVLFFDLDRFKVINDSLGHVAGDQLLIAIAQKILTLVKKTDLAVRLGGDEFVILLDEIHNIQAAIHYTEQIFNLLRQPFRIGDREVYITTSVGIVLGSAKYDYGVDILRDADIAMYRAKKQGKARYEIFDTQMHAQAIARLHLENDLRQAIAHQHFVLLYQPIICLADTRLIGFEALVRWHHPEQGVISPNQFVPIAEETGLMTHIDYWVLRTACQQLAQWQKTFPQCADYKISVNLSAQDLQRHNLLIEIDDILTTTGLSGSCLTLEITESMLIEDVESTIALLAQLKARGIQISIDDFGTGYSSLSYLHRLPIDNLKVDQSFVKQMQDSRRNYQIIQTIMTLSNHLGLVAIAEGIETPRQLTQLQDMGYQWGQGYLFAKPLRSEKISNLLAENWGFGSRVNAVYNPVGGVD